MTSSGNEQVKNNFFTEKFTGLFLEQSSTLKQNCLSKTAKFGNQKQPNQNPT